MEDLERYKHRIKSFCTMKLKIHRKMFQDWGPKYANTVFICEHLIENSQGDQWILDVRLNKIRHGASETPTCPETPPEADYSILRIVSPEDAEISEEELLSFSFVDAEALNAEIQRTLFDRLEEIEER